MGSSRCLPPTPYSQNDRLEGVVGISRMRHERPRHTDPLFLQLTLLRAVKTRREGSSPMQRSPATRMMLARSQQRRRIRRWRLTAARAHLGVRDGTLIVQPDDGAVQHRPVLRQAKHSNARHPLYEDRVLNAAAAAPCRQQTSPRGMVKSARGRGGRGG